MATNLSELKFPATSGRHLATLLEIGGALSNTISPRTAFQRALEILEQHFGMVRGTVTLLEQKSGEIRIEASIGLTEAGRSAHYRLGEGITGRVVESGKPIVVPQVSREPMFLNRSQRKDLHRQEITFVGVPLFVNGKP